MPPSTSDTPVTHQHLIDLFQTQNAKFDSIERQMEKVTEVLTRIALLEERRTQDREIMERLETRVDKVETSVRDIKDEQNKKHPQYDEMLDSYKQFKKAVIVFICSGILGAVLLVSGVKIPLGK